jgi:hypothetical protein
MADGFREVGVSICVKRSRNDGLDVKIADAFLVSARRSGAKQVDTDELVAKEGTEASRQG